MQITRRDINLSFFKSSIIKKTVILKLLSLESMDLRGKFYNRVNIFGSPDPISDRFSGTDSSRSFVKWNPSSMIPFDEFSCFRQKSINLIFLSQLISLCTIRTCN